MQKRAMIKAEKAQKKAVKMAAAEAYRSKKPGECLKVCGYFTFKSVPMFMLQRLAKCNMYIELTCIVSFHYLSNICKFGSLFYICLVHVV
jgi:hypothetical protein